MVEITTAAVAIALLSKRPERALGQAYWRYVCSRIPLNVSGTLTANSWGGAYWQW